MSRRTWAFLESQQFLEGTHIPRLIILCGILLLLLCVLVTPSRAQSVPTGTVTPPSLATPGTEWLFDAALGADMLQSLEIHRTGYVETNTILGAHPNQAQIAGYFVGMGVAHYLLTRALIREHVSSSIIQAWEAGTIGLEMAYVKHNASLGVHFYVP